MRLTLKDLLDLGVDASTEIRTADNLPVRSVLVSVDGNVMWLSDEEDYADETPDLD